MLSFLWNHGNVVESIAEISPVQWFTENDTKIVMRMRFDLMCH